MARVVKALGQVVPAVLVSVALTSCLGSSSGATTHLRGVNLVTDSPDLEFTVDTVDVSSATYGAMTPLTAAGPGSHAIQVAGVNPSDLVTQPTITYTPFGTPVNETLAANVGYTVVAYGTTSDPKFIVSSDTDLDSPVPQYEVIYKIMDVATKGPPVIVFITAPGAGITSRLEIARLNFGESTNDTTLTIAIPPGLLNSGATLSLNLTIELENALTGEDVIPANTLTVTEQERVLFVIADNIGPGSTPIVIDALAGAAGDSASGVLFANPADDAELAFANVTATAPPFNVIGGLNLQSTLAKDIGFGQKSAYGNVNSGVAGTIAAPTADPSHLTFLVSFVSQADQSYTEYAVGPLPTIVGVVLQDDRRSVPVEGEFRFLNAAYEFEFGPAMDIYLVPHDMGLNILATNGNRPPPNYTAVAFKSSTPYLQVSAGVYDAYFANTGTSDIILGPIFLSIADGSITTYVFTNEANGVLELLPFNDVKPPQ
ncbi:MAG TPA: hypothetical protein VK820_08455 [Steroidobacteraceae bacterium]|jgi:hypothetical protein|nr:hypothetical protein [Steroidobacteraceae bacterium]